VKFSYVKGTQVPQPPWRRGPDMRSTPVDGHFSQWDRNILRPRDSIRFSWDFRQQRNRSTRPIPTRLPLKRPTRLHRKLTVTRFHCKDRLRDQYRSELGKHGTDRVNLHHAGGGGGGGGGSFTGLQDPVSADPATDPEGWDLEVDGSN